MVVKYRRDGKPCRTQNFGCKTSGQESSWGMYRRKKEFKIHIRKMACADVNWTEVAQGRVQWRTFVNMVIKQILVEQLYNFQLFKDILM
jgi:hypothetical protein